MNMIATRLAPDANGCWHMLGIVPGAEGGNIVIDRNNKELVDKYGGYSFTFCPICGQRLLVEK